MFGLHPLLQLVRRDALFEFHTVGFEHVPEQRKRFFRLGSGLFRSVAAPALDDVAPARTADIDEICFLQLLYEIREAPRPVGSFTESRVELKHCALQES